MVSISFSILNEKHISADMSCKAGVLSIRKDFVPSPFAHILFLSCLAEVLTGNRKKMLRQKLPSPFHHKHEPLLLRCYTRLLPTTFLLPVPDAHKALDPCCVIRSQPACPWSPAHGVTDL